MSYPVEKKELHVPSLAEASKVIANGLAKNFSEATCEVVSCPDLTERPWSLAASGLSGSPCIGEIGGVPFLMPLANKEKIYDFKNIGKDIGLPDAFILGAGAGPHKYVGVNCEHIPNITVGSKLINESRYAKVGESGQCVIDKVPQDETTCAVLLNFYACEGKPGNVLRIKAKKRTGQLDFVGCIRKSLEDKYGHQSVGIGGTFRVTSGSVKIHIMPDFSTTALNTSADVDQWLKYYDTKDPITFMSVAVSRDPSMDFRLEHSHGYNDTEGGHYHYDVTPDEVEYEGYFNLADFICRLDRPPK